MSIYERPSLSTLKKAADNGDLSAAIALVDQLLLDKSRLYPYPDYYTGETQTPTAIDLGEYDSPSDEALEGAFKYSKIAAEGGDPEGMWRLAWRYYNGDGCEQSKKEALKWWKKASEKGHAESRKQIEKKETFFDKLFG